MDQGSFPWTIGCEQWSTIVMEKLEGWATQAQNSPETVYVDHLLWRWDLGETVADSAAHYKVSALNLDQIGLRWILVCWSGETEPAILSRGEGISSLTFLSVLQCSEPRLVFLPTSNHKATGSHSQTFFPLFLLNSTMIYCSCQWASVCQSCVYHWTCSHPRVVNTHSQTHISRASLEHLYIDTKDFQSTPMLNLPTAALDTLISDIPINVTMVTLIMS